MIIDTENNGKKTGHIDISDYVCSDGEIEIEVANSYGDVVYKFINKDQAQQIIEHLQQQFNL